MGITWDSKGDKTHKVSLKYVWKHLKKTLPLKFSSGNVLLISIMQFELKLFLLLLESSYI